MSVTSEPTSATRPENSLPSTWGKRIVTPGGVQPVRMAASVGCTPALILDHHFVRLGDGALQAMDVEFFGRPEALNRGSSHVRVEPADDACRFGRAGVVDYVVMCHLSLQTRSK